MDFESEKLAAKYLSSSRLDGARLDEIEPGMRPATEAEAYRVQAQVHDVLTAGGRGEVVGHKIGCTTPVMQEYLGIHNPCAGGIFEPTVTLHSGSVDFASYLHVGVECELAVRLSDDLPGSDSPHTRDSVAGSVESLMAAIEIVDDRWIDYSSVSTPTLIADDFFGAGCVLGQPSTGWRELELAAIRGGMSINGESVGEGVGGDILGHPLEALAWLANSMNKRGDALKAGEFVLLGSLVQTKWLEQGDLVEIAVDHLGEASVRFE